MCLIEKKFLGLGQELVHYKSEDLLSFFPGNNGSKADNFQDYIYFEEDKPRNPTILLRKYEKKS